jgi:hypothetical protein
MNAFHRFLAFAALLGATTAQGAALGSGFTYQGELRVSNVPANGSYDLQFELFDASSGGAQVGTTVLANDVAISNGVLSVELDFGFAAFDGTQLWIELGVREGSSSGGYQGLAPRQKLTATPYALHSVNAETVDTLPPHDHVGETWVGSEEMWILDLRNLVEDEPTAGALLARSNSEFSTVYGVNLDSDGIGEGIYGATNGTGAGLRGYSRLGPGLSVASFAGANIIMAYDDNPVRDLRFRVSAAGNVFADGSYTGGGADVAEFVEHHGTLEPGDVVAIAADGKYERAHTAGSAAVAGVITTRPGVLMNATDGRETLEDAPAMALAGRVPVKVTSEGGPIRPGDLLIASSTHGHAMRAPDEPRAGTVIGKALGRLDEARGRVEMLVMLR